MQLDTSPPTQLPLPLQVAEESPSPATEPEVRPCEAWKGLSPMMHIEVRQTWRRILQEVVDDARKR